MWEDPPSSYWIILSNKPVQAHYFKEDISIAHDYMVLKNY